MQGAGAPVDKAPEFSSPGSLNALGSPGEGEFASPLAGEEVA